jgi:hypothetical protein
MTSAHRLAGRPLDGGLGDAAFRRAEAESTVGSSRLRDHLLRDHGRAGREIDGLPLADLHRFEHVEQAMGLNDLSHRHLAPAEHPGTVGSEGSHEGR